MFRKSPNSSFCIGAFLCLLFFNGAAPVSAAQPFLTQDQNPFSLIHGQPQPVAAQLPDAGATQWLLTLDITNTLNAEAINGENLLIDYESYHLRLAWLYGLNEDWALKIDVPLIHYGGGFLDYTIDRWHEFFGLPRADRPNVSHDQFHIFYTRDGQTLINLDSPDGGLGDIQLALGRDLLQSPRSNLSLWFSVDLPTGDQATLTGNNRSDLSLWLAADHRFHRNWSVDANIGMLFPGNAQIATLAIENQVYFGYAALQWQAHERFQLRAQFNAHTRFYADSELLLLGSAYNMVLGGRIHLSKCSDLDLAFSEDIQVGATPDVSFLLSWNTRFDCE
ncbi:MAG: DUF3187 family protein [Gammaproteobacteria bacterium]|nr:DUF3187 family protein [Gammaproteobacteria bacterium]